MRSKLDATAGMRPQELQVFEPLARPTQTKSTRKPQDNASKQFNQEEPIELATNQIAMFAFATLATRATQLARPLPINSLAICLLLASACCQSASANANHLIESAAALSAPSDGLLQAAGPLPLIFGAQQQLAAAGEKPRLIPLVASDSGYSANSSVNVLCTVSQGHHESLTFEWFKDGQPIQEAGRQEESFFELAKLAASNAQAAWAAPQIEKHQDHSLLRISRVQPHHAGRYSCAAKNQFGQDSSSVNLVVNVKMQWIKEPPKELVVSLNQELKVECLAQGEPRPSMRWEKLDSTGHTFSSAPTKERKQAPAHHAHGQMDSASSSKSQLSPNFNGNKLSHHRAESAVASSSASSSASQAGSTLVSSTRHLTITRARESDSGLYECVASNGHDHDLRKLVHVQVRAPANFNQKFHIQQAKLGDSIQLECQANGDQPLRIDWFQGANESSVPLDRNGNEFYEIHEAPAEPAGLTSLMELRSLQTRHSQLYKCVARNEFGSSERIIKLIVSNVPEKPTNLHLRDVWSRSALISWSPSQSGGEQQQNGRATNFTVQFWRKTAPGAKQNHRRESLVVDGLQTSALLPNLLPALTYEVSVIGQNQVGQGEPSETIQLTTSEEEPSAPPTDVQVEPRGASTIRVLWKVPPVESVNGKLLGFYIGYRPRASQMQSLAPSMNSVVQPAGLQQAQQQSAILSFKTADAVEGLTNYESFLTNLKPLHEYEVTVRAFNKAGSGPDCHVLLARTGSPRLPAAPTLQVQRVTSNAVALKWTAPPQASSPQPLRQLTASRLQPLGMPNAVQPAGGLAQQHFELFYQIQGEHDWYQLSVGQSAAQAASQQLEADLLGQSSQVVEEAPAVNIHTLSNLQPALTYRIYVAAVNEFGVGDPSNVVTVKTSDTAPSSLLQSAGFLGSAQLDGPESSGHLGSSPASHLLELLTQPQHGHFYTLLSSLALLLMLVVLFAYFVWQRRLKCKYNSSNASSYPSSWTPAASDTIQSEYSIKRLPSSTVISAQQHHHPAPLQPQAQLQPQLQAQLQPQSQYQQQQDLYDEVECVLAQQQPPAPSVRNQRLRPSRTSGKQLRNSATMSRPVLSSHYHQPASLIGPPAGAATLQFQHAQAGGQKARQPSASGSGPAQQFRMSATLNRYQNRQLPPIPYGSMSMQKEQQQQEQQETGGGPSSKQRQAPLGAPPLPNSFAPGHCGSQTPLIYGPIE